MLIVGALEFGFLFFVPLFYVQGVMCSCPALGYCDCGADHYVSFTLELTRHGSQGWYGAAYFPDGRGLYYVLFGFDHEWGLNLNRP